MLQNAKIFTRKKMDSGTDNWNESSIVDLACMPHREFFDEIEKRVACYSVKLYMVEQCTWKIIKGFLICYLQYNIKKLKRSVSGSLYTAFTISDKDSTIWIWPVSFQIACFCVSH